MSEIAKLRKIIREVAKEELEKPEVGYHVAPLEKHYDIKYDGIVPLKSRKDVKGDPTAEKTYFWSDLDTAKWFRNFHGRHEYEIWKVDLSGLDIKPDPETENMEIWSPDKFDENDSWAGWYYEGKVEPERLIGTVD